MCASSYPLERALKRLEYDRVREREMKDAAAAEERERDAMMAIDWWVSKQCYGARGYYLI